MWNSPLGEESHSLALQTRCKSAHTGSSCWERLPWAVLWPELGWELPSPPLLCTAQEQQDRTAPSPPCTPSTLQGKGSLVKRDAGNNRCLFRRYNLVPDFREPPWGLENRSRQSAGCVYSVLSHGLKVSVTAKASDKRNFSSPHSNHLSLISRDHQAQEWALTEDCIFLLATAAGSFCSESVTLYSQPHSVCCNCLCHIKSVNVNTVLQSWFS